MKTFRICSLTVLAAATLAACSSVPPANDQLDQARSAYRSAQGNTRVQAQAPAELKQAGDSLAQAEAAYARHDDANQVNQLSYLARQRVSLAEQAAARKDAEVQVADAAAARNQMRLAARTQEADTATRNAASAQRDAASSQRQADAALRQSANSQQLAAASQQQALASQQQAAVAQQQAGDAERRNDALQAQLRDLNAIKTARGLVITIGDVLFDTNQSVLKSGGMRHIERLGGFLKEYPQRKAAIEGYTDSTGSDSYNMALSDRRAQAVRGALLGMGVAAGQVVAQGYGETHPVAGNESAGGRQLNRRVEIVLSDEAGVVAPR